jgi:hypothetical protein
VGAGGRAHHGRGFAAHALPAVGLPPRQPGPHAAHVLLPVSRPGQHRGSGGGGAAHAARRLQPHPFLAGRRGRGAAHGAGAAAAALPGRLGPGVALPGGRAPPQALPLPPLQPAGHRLAAGGRRGAVQRQARDLRRPRRPALLAGPGLAGLRRRLHAARPPRQQGGPPGAGHPRVLPQLGHLSLGAPLRAVARHRRVCRHQLGHVPVGPQDVRLRAALCGRGGACCWGGGARGPGVRSLHGSGRAMFGFHFFSLYGGVQPRRQRGGAEVRGLQTSLSCASHQLPLSLPRPSAATCGSPRTATSTPPSTPPP